MEYIRPMRLSFLLGLLLLVIASISHEAAQSAADVRGTVLKKGTDVPLSGAKVLLTKVAGGAQDAFAVVGDENGMFALSNIPLGTYRLFVEREGYLRTEFGQERINMPGRPLSVTGSQQAPVLIELTELAVIRGRVDTESRTAGRRFRVRAMKARYEEGRRVLSLIKETATDDLGDFRLFDLTPGRYFIGVYPPSAVGRSSQDNVQMAGSTMEVAIPAYFPGKTSDPQRALPIDLKAGETIDVGLLTSLRVPPIRVSGEIIDGVTGGVTGRLATSCEVQLKAGGIENVRSLSKENCKGKFDFSGLEPGRYVIYANVPKPAGTLTSRGELEIEAGTTDVGNLKVILKGDSTLKGRMSFEGRPRSDNDPELARLQIHLPRGGASMVAVNRDGTFSFSRVSPGTYQPNIMGLSPGVYVKAMRMGNRDLLDSGLVVSGQVSGVLEIVLSSRGAAVTALVLDSLQRPFSAGATVALVPDSDRRKNWNLYRSAMTDSAGNVQLRGIPPGDYTLFAWEDVDENAWQSPEFLQQHEGRGIRVHLTEGTREDVRVPLIPGNLSR